MNREEEEARQFVIDTTACPYCFQAKGLFCRSYSSRVGTCTLNVPHTSRTKAAKKVAGIHPSHTIIDHLREVKMARVRPIVHFRAEGRYTVPTFPIDPQDGTNEGYDYTDPGVFVKPYSMADAETTQLLYDRRVQGPKALEIIDAVRCNFCQSPIGVPCIIWNRKKTQPREFPHAVRYSDAHKMKREREAKTTLYIDPDPGLSLIHI